MARINVLSGDFLQGDGDYHSGILTLVTPLFPWPGISFKHSDIQSMEIASQASRKSIDDTIGMGLAGALMLGPVGAAAGMMLAGEDKEVTFLVNLKDGRTLLAASDDKTFRRIARHIGLNL